MRRANGCTRHPRTTFFFLSLASSYRLASAGAVEELPWPVVGFGELVAMDGVCVLNAIMPTNPRAATNAPRIHATASLRAGGGRGGVERMLFIGICISSERICKR